MKQNRLAFDGYTPPNVTEDGYQLAFATTSTASSGRVMRGTMINEPMFTVEAYKLKWVNISADDASKILQSVIGKSSFMFFHYSLYYNEWIETPFFVANVDAPIISLKLNDEKLSSLSFQVTGTYPI